MTARAPLTVSLAGNAIARRLHILAEQFQAGDFDDDLFTNARPDIVKLIYLIPALLREIANAIEDEVRLPAKVKRRPHAGRRFGGGCDAETSPPLAEDYRDSARQNQDRPLISEVGLPRSRP